jgi:hypothetical protein
VKRSAMPTTTRARNASSPSAERTVTRSGTFTDSPDARWPGG